MLDGRVRQVGADAADRPVAQAGEAVVSGQLLYRTLVELAAPHLEVDGRHYPLPPECRSRRRSGWASALCWNTSCRQSARPSTRQGGSVDARMHGLRLMAPM